MRGTTKAPQAKEQNCEEKMPQKKEDSVIRAESWGEGKWWNWLEQRLCDREQGQATGARSIVAGTQELCDIRTIQRQWFLRQWRWGRCVPALQEFGLIQWPVGEPRESVSWGGAWLMISSSEMTLTLVRVESGQKENCTSETKRQEL